MKPAIVVCIATIAFLIHAAYGASNEHIDPADTTDQRTHYCQQVLNDQIVIAQAIANGASQDKIEGVAQRSTNINDERKASIMKLIDEAYKASDATEWLNVYWTKCMGEDI